MSMESCPVCRSDEILPFCPECNQWHYIEGPLESPVKYLRKRCLTCGIEFVEGVR